MTAAYPRLAAFTALLIASTVSVSADPLPFTEKMIAADTKNYAVEVHYPETGLAAIDQVIVPWAKDMKSAFIKQADEDMSSMDGPDRPEWNYSLDVGYEVARNDDKAFAAIFSEDTFTGGAHPNHDIDTFNFLMPDGWRVFLPEIFNGKPALEKISALAIADLVRQFDGPDSMSDDDWLKTGAGPNWDNFEDFLLLPDTLVLHFPPYQVAAYAAGAQSVEIPLSELAGLMRKDWRTPVASFDCALAKSAVEKAICSDVPLARLDRNVASAYGRGLQYAEDAEKTKLRDAQRAWIKARDSQCADGSVACLTQSYQARLAALNPSG